MRHTFFLTAIATSIALLSACSKKTATAITKNPFTFSISRPPDVTIQQYIDTLFYLDFDLKGTNGISDSVFVNSDILPKGVRLVWLGVGFGKTDFTWKFQTEAKIDTPGTYPARFYAYSNYGDTQYSNFNIIVASDTFCAFSLPGHYSNHTTCFSLPGMQKVSDNTYNDLVTGGKSYIQLSIAALNYPGQPLSLTVNCANGTLSNFDYGAMDEFYNYHVNSDSCTFSESVITLNYNIVDFNEYPAVYRYTCQTMYTR